MTSDIDIDFLFELSDAKFGEALDNGTGNPPPTLEVVGLIKQSLGYLELIIAKLPELSSELDFLVVLVVRHFALVLAYRELCIDGEFEIYGEKLMNAIASVRKFANQGLELNSDSFGCLDFLARAIFLLAEVNREGIPTDNFFASLFQSCPNYREYLGLVDNLLEAFAGFVNSGSYGLSVCADDLSNIFVHIALLDAFGDYSEAVSLRKTICETIVEIDPDALVSPTGDDVVVESEIMRLERYIEIEKLKAGVILNAMQKGG